MIKLLFKWLFLRHKLLQFLGVIDKDNYIIKIWWDDYKQDTFLFANIRSGSWHMPVGRKCSDEKKIYSFWIASLSMTAKCGLSDNKKNKTIYSLVDVREWENTET